MSTTDQQSAQAHPAWEQAEPGAHARDPRAVAFTEAHPERPIPAVGPVDDAPITTTPSTGLEELWRSIVTESRTRANDIHLPTSTAYAQRLCDAYPQADRELVLATVILHDTGWAHVDESRIISEGFQGDWRKAAIRYEHEAEGCAVARRVLPALGYDERFVERVCEIIDGHDTRPVAFSLEDALVRDADRLWRFDVTGVCVSSSWFGMDPATYTDRLDREILPELLTEAAVRMARADLARTRALLRTEVLR
ncbi:HD domain-containing protein [Citricoccus sp. SGAir0253]|uniref:HD domain-containing protein n=1 Tax=Citricoccus sp. SGAir0253 TaxID=2567881 RepID=UPI0010CD3575|nr:HD domain-containing protein [Citricoccus sp. SGAir0253]QCU78935.1 HD domain-containing protein [Citricoccus sp. SGAir0253]